MFAGNFHDALSTLEFDAQPPLAGHVVAEFLRSSAERLRRAWQTRIYLYLTAAGGAALAPDTPSAFVPDRISLTYWYVEDPAHPRSIAYDEAAHRRNRIELEAIVAEIDRQLVANEWPLTDEWSECRHCPYRAYCGRQAAGAAPLDVAAEEDEERDDPDMWLEPQWG